MKIAVIKTGGKQYLIKEGDRIEIEKIKKYENEENPQIFFDEVLFYADDKEVIFGGDQLRKVKVEASLERKKKVKTLVWKYKPKTRYRKKKGYKKEKWIVKITSINFAFPSK